MKPRQPQDKVVRVMTTRASDSSGSRYPTLRDSLLLSPTRIKMDPSGALVVVYAGTVRFRMPRKPAGFGEMKVEVAPHSISALTVRADPSASQISTSCVKLAGRSIPHMPRRKEGAGPYNDTRFQRKTAERCRYLYIKCGQ